MYPFSHYVKSLPLLTAIVDLLQICLNVADKGDAFGSFDELYDLPEQSMLREDCQSVVGMYSLQSNILSPK